MDDRAWLTVVGIGEDGLSGLGREACAAIEAATQVFGGERHLALLAPQSGQQRRPWPRPFALAYDQVLAHRGEPVCVLASGDPMFYGIGSQLAERLPLEELRVLPAPSSMSLAAARLGWPLQQVRVVPAHGRPLARVARYLAEGVRLLVLSADGETPEALARLLVTRGYGASQLCVFGRMGGPEETRRDGTAASWLGSTTDVHRVAPDPSLNLVAVHCHADPGTRPLSRRSALPDSAFEHDGQLTKRDVRALTLARLAPQPGELLWDVGAGCGSIGIEWLRAESSCRAIAIESHPDRCGFIERNRDRLGVPELELVAGQAPAVLAELATPDAIFIGGGLTVDGVVEHCWQALRPGGRLVANAVTLQTESALVAWRGRIGGELTRVSVAQAEPLGRFDGWRTARPITLLSAEKPLADTDR
ncbi:cobalamin biosynthesis bifunctional protein CbiET [Lamprobacter modestohalophilus]|uniref:Cobalamin biosynthesis bifunctional protein CbiET n=1 Tax=Lamprobacter modestohalophilus TaxID=1064514 RepID=A0A9X0WCA8_9GAMM|nr:precorrin-6y C5,15-methyltransferase (decarboxylating) subunit CbiE [Lamprobacter modestohalophilus]MBK1620844.1 cobalamin biosynthesis bifunctional protein CbiET [Lamprobacter modestohalophilus]